MNHNRRICFWLQLTGTELEEKHVLVSIVFIIIYLSCLYLPLAYTTVSLGSIF